MLECCQSLELGRFRRLPRSERKHAVDRNSRKPNRGKDLFSFVKERPEKETYPAKLTIDDGEDAACFVVMLMVTANLELDVLVP